MVWQDLVNGLFELFAGFFVLMHCRRLHIDKLVKGVSLVATIFFTTWGVWNLYYYPWLEQWLSFFGGLAIVSANALWIGMMFYYTLNPGGRRLPLPSAPAPRSRSALTFD